MPVQIHMWGAHKKRLLQRHSFYVEQVKARVLSQFRNISAEAEKFADDEYNRIDQNSSYYEIDEGTAAEIANDRAEDFYFLLHDLRGQMALGALAGLYHQWDKDLRDFIESELTKDGVVPEDTKRYVWRPEIGAVFDLLKEFGWDCRNEPFYSELDACRLVVNVYKHGKGKSLDDLVAKYPYFLSTGVPDTAWPKNAAFLDHEWLTVSEEQFNQIAEAIAEFWRRFPERLFLLDAATQA